MNTTYKKLFPYLTHTISFMFLTAMFLGPLSLGAQGTGGNISSSPKCTALLGGNIGSLKDIIDFVTCLVVKSIIPFLFVLALTAFVYGVIQYFLNPNNAKEKTAARTYILWALIGMFVLFSVSGLVNILRNTFGVENSPIPLLPETQ